MLGGRPSCVITISASLFAFRSAPSAFRRSFRALSSLAQPERHKMDRATASRARPGKDAKLNTVSWCGSVIARAEC